MDQLNAPSRQLLPYLSRIRGRMRLRDGLELAQRTFWLAGAAALVLLIAGRIFPIEHPWRWALVPIALWLVGVLGYALFRPLPPMRVARRADAELHLKERLSSSLALDEIRDSAVYASFDAHLVERAHADALQAVRHIHPPRDFPLRAQRRDLLISAGMLVAALLLVWLPNPMDKIIAERKAVEQEARRQAEKIDDLREEIEKSEAMSPEERDELLRKLAELAKQLRENSGDREQALADLSRLEESLRQKMDPKAGQRQAALDAMAAQLQALAKEENPQIGDLEAAKEALEKLAEQMEAMSQEERQAMAQQLAQMASRAAQAGDSGLAQALAAMAQAMQSGDAQAAEAAAQQARKAMEASKSTLANQAAMGKTVSQLQNSRQSIAAAGQQPGSQMAQGQGQGQGQGQNPGQGQGQGQQAGGGGGTSANSLPPGTRKGQAGAPTGPGQDTGVSQADSQVYVPREKLNASTGNEVFIPGQDTDQGETQTREQRDPLSGVNNPSLVPYSEVFGTYRDAADQALEQSYIPPSLKDYIKNYFTQLEP
jgi:hypothetical protein